MGALTSHVIDYPPLSLFNSSQISPLPEAWMSMKKHGRTPDVLILLLSDFFISLNIPPISKLDQKHEYPRSFDFHPLSYFKSPLNSPPANQNRPKAWINVYFRELLSTPRIISLWVFRPAFLCSWIYQEANKKCLSRGVVAWPIHLYQILLMQLRLLRFRLYEFFP